MPLLFNLRHLARASLALKGELSAEELALETRDELIRGPHPLAYDMEVDQFEDSVLVRGRLRIVLACECVRCLKAFEHPVALEDWICHLPLQGDDKAHVVNDCLDLTPYVREDILLALPLHPLCGSKCGELTYPPKTKKKGSAGASTSVSPAWAELNKLKLLN